MLSTLLELCGLASLTEAAYIFGGRGWAYATAGTCLLLVGAVTDDGAIRSFGSRTRARVQRRLPGGKAPAAPAGASPHPSLDDLLDPGQEELYAHLAESAERRTSRP